MNEPTIHVERKKRINRLQVIYIMVFVLFAAIIVRLEQLQIQQGGQYASELMIRSFKKNSIPAMRGNIYDRTGHVIAQSRPSFLVVFRERESMKKEDYIRLIEKLERS